MSRALELALLQAAADRAAAEQAVAAAHRAVDVARAALDAAEVRMTSARVALEQFSARACAVPWQRAQLDLNGLRAEVDDARAARQRCAHELEARRDAVAALAANLQAAQQSERVLERGIERAARPVSEREDD